MENLMTGAKIRLFFNCFKKTLLVNKFYAEIYPKSSSEFTFLWNLGKFEIQLNQPRGPMEFMQNCVFSSGHYRKNGTCLDFIFTQFVTYTLIMISEPKIKHEERIENIQKRMDELKQMMLDIQKEQIILKGKGFKSASFEPRNAKNGEKSLDAISIRKQCNHWNDTSKTSQIPNWHANKLTYSQGVSNLFPGLQWQTEVTKGYDF